MLTRTEDRGIRLSIRAVTKSVKEREGRIRSRRVKPATLEKVRTIPIATRKLSSREIFKNLNIRRRTNKYPAKELGWEKVEYGRRIEQELKNRLQSKLATPIVLTVNGLSPRK